MKNDTIKQKEYADSVNILGTPPGTYSIEDDKDTIEIPFEFYGMNLLIHGKINGKKVKLLIDNGSLWDPVWFYNGEVDSIGLHYINDNVSEVSGVGEDSGSAIKEGNTVDIDFKGIKFFDQPTLISMKEAGYDQYFPGVNGQISAMLFKHFIVTFNFECNTMILTKPDAFASSDQGNPIPMKKANFESYSIDIWLKFKGKDEILMPVDLDLGTVAPLYLIENPTRNMMIPENTEKKLYGYGASGAIYTYAGKLEKVIVGDYTLSHVPFEMAEKSANVNSNVVEIGTLGLPLLMKFNVTFDYFRKQIYFEPNKNFREDFINIWDDN